LIRWYQKHARDLPWRRTDDPYRIWISEIMLQQTTVVAVVPYFDRFLDRFPDVQTLAAADEAEVLKLWEGLGYYSRARNIHKAAKAVVAHHEGVFPSEVAMLLELPGIGRYTAGAIASFAFDKRAPIVEANTLRLYCRLLGYAGDPRSTEGQRRLWEFAEAILPKTQPGRFNQALMELGATVCSPRTPDCEHCPVQSYCRANLDQTQATIPQLARRAQITEVTEASVAVRRNNAYLLRRRTAGERWAGLWDFVRFELDAAAHESLHIVEQVQVQTGLQIDLGPQLAELKHGVTRYRITLKCFTAEATTGSLRADEEWEWVRATKFDQFPLSVTGRKFAKLLAESLF
jgi:A/G-specific adenine glycosylase